MAERAVADLLAFEREWANRPQYDGRKDQAITERFGVSSTAYYQALNAAIDSREALELAPVTVRLVRQRRERGMRQWVTRVG